MSPNFFESVIAAGAILTGLCGTFLAFRIQREGSEICLVDALRKILSAAMIFVVCVPAFAVPILEYRFNETGQMAPSTGNNKTALTFKDNLGLGADLHGEDGSGVSGLRWDRAFDNSARDGQSNNGGRGEQADLNAIDELVSFSLTGWYLPADTFSTAAPRVFFNFKDNKGFVFTDPLTRALGQPGAGSLAVDARASATSANGGYPADVRTWVFFAITYDGTAAMENVKYYRGFRSDVEAGRLGNFTSAVALLSTLSSNSGTLDSEDQGLLVGNGPGGGATFFGLLDDLRIFGTKEAGDRSGVLTKDQLETVRRADVRNTAIALSEPSSLVLLGSVLLMSSALWPAWRNMTLLRKKSVIESESRLQEKAINHS